MERTIISDIVTADLPDILQLALRVNRRHVLPTLSAEGEQALMDSLQQDISALVDSRRYRSLKVRHKNRIAGYIAWRDGNHLAHLFIDLDQQGQGLGRRLLDEMRRRVRADHITVRASLNAVGFYERYGFFATGEATEHNGIRYLPMALAL